MLAPVGVLCMELAAPATGACGARAVMVTRRRHSDAGEGMGWEGNRLRAQKAARVLKKGVNVFWDLALTAARMTANTHATLTMEQSLTTRTS